MPEMDGFETYKKLREREKEREILETPVIFLTGDSDEETERYGLRLGASDFIHKPFNKDILIRRIKNTVSFSRRLETLTEDATTDKLTGFLNKTSGIAKVTAAISSLKGMLTVLDLDSFKLVNDLFGHEKGDRVLEAFAEVVRSNVRGQDIVSRIGGDEFMAFFCDLTEASAVNALTKRLNDQFAAGVDALLGEGHGIPIGISVGAVKVPEYGRDYEDLFKMADKAMYQAKQAGKHCCRIFTSGVQG